MGCGEGGGVEKVSGWRWGECRGGGGEKVSWWRGRVGGGVEREDVM